MLFEGSNLEILLAFITSFFGIIAFTIGVHGWNFKNKMYLIPRIAFLISGLLLVYVSAMTAIIGLIILVIASIVQMYYTKRLQNAL